jgi:hypothetical protein
MFSVIFSCDIARICFSCQTSGPVFRPNFLALSVSDSAHRYRDLLSPGIRRGENTGYFQFNAVKTRRIQAYYNDLLLCVFKNIQMQNWVSLHRQKRIQWTR